MAAEYLRGSELEKRELLKMVDSESNSKQPSKTKKPKLLYYLQRYRKEYSIKYLVVMKSGFA